jgi:hypothetical protein
MGVDSKTRELLTLWHERSPEARPACSKRGVTLALAAGLEKTLEFEALFKPPAADSDKL